MSRFYLFGTYSLFFVLLFGCSSNELPAESNNGNELVSETSINENSSRANELNEKGYEEEQEVSSSTDSLSTPIADDSVSLKEMELLKKTLRTYIFDEYMGSSDYGYAKGINWSKNFYDNLTAEEIWNVIEKYKEMNNGEEGTLFDQASYLTMHAPIKDNWKEMFLENWYNSPYSDSNEIETMIDKGDSVWIFTDTLPYSGEKDNYPFITLFKNTGNWHG
ncbi:hypothetical protein J2Y03_004807 [Neobacillus niacini]|uniref:hypothetical protein n=1 Tax=Neobacillus niacini TaxID=86668 RepID=UPI0028620413|nr:hypothetical protein [Neobacillus niacini]MDR7079749.1 hypothetical protein [Neobacillus niacini]